MIYKNEKPAILMFQDGTYHEGIGFGAVGKVKGEITFTAIPGSGYVEILTDPTYKDKILMFTYPSIGNYGVPAKEKDDNGIVKQFESDKIQLKGMIVNEYCEEPSHYESIKTLEQWMIEEYIPGIQWIDTRMITQQFVVEGSKLGILEVLEKGEKPNITELQNEAKNLTNLEQEDLVKTCSTTTVINYMPPEPKGKVVVIDLGVKNNILRTLLAKNLSVDVVPYNYPSGKIGELKADGVLFSNGPGNPNVLKDTIETAKQLIEKNVPMMGIGTGNMIFGLSAGAICNKMTAEHRGGRTTVESATGHCYITFQNHAYCLKDFEKGGFKQLYHDKDDNTNEGLMHETKPIFSVAFNPEASPGALDMKDVIFNKFIKLMEV